MIVLEPVKPVAVYLAGTGHVATGTIVLVVGEILKLVLVERLFSVSRDKLMSIPAFAWCYWKYRAIKDWIISAEAWQAIQRWRRVAQYAIQSYVRELKAFPEASAHYLSTAVTKNVGIGFRSRFR